jgi:glycosyltransferase involved in cell wall biosynthesis
VSRSLRILQVTDLYDPFIGGMESHVKALSHGLVRLGHEVTVATARLPGTAADETVDGLRIRRFTGWSARALASWYEQAEAPFHPPLPDPGVVAELKRVINESRPDVVHAQGWITYSCLMMARHRRFKLVVTVHDHGFMCARKTLLRNGETICSGPRLSACLRCAPGHYGIAKGAALTLGLRAAQPLHDRADSWVAVSKFAADTNRRALPRAAKISIIPPASERVPVSGERLSWLPADGYLLYVGALARYKGLHWLLDAYEASGVSRPLVIIGTPRQDTPRTWPRGVIARSNVPHRDVMTAWHHAGIGLVPSLCLETFGLVAVEAMRSGVPTVASRMGALPGIVAEGITGLLVTPRNTAELRAAIQRLDGDPGLRRAMGAAAQARSEQFSPEAVTRQYEEHYRSLLGKSHSAGSSPALPAGGNLP